MISHEHCFYGGKRMKQKQISSTPQEISAVFGIPAGTLANLRSQKRGPKYYKRGRRVIYFIQDIEQWLKSQPVQTIDSV